jgi:hypothetical protein
MIDSSILLGNHLQEDQPGDVLARFVLDDLDLLATHDEVANVLERHMLADRGVVKPPIGVLLDQPFFGHGCQSTAEQKKRTAA